MKSKMPIIIPIISSVILLVLTVLTFTIWNPPQCPYNYTQVQVDASNCIVGANIGTGMIFMFILIPVTLATIGFWVGFFNSTKKK